MTLNLPDHTPAQATLAFAHELAVLAATQTGDETMSDELAALATAMRDARTDANVLYDLLERALNVAAVVKPAVNVLTGEVKSLRQQVDALTKERDGLQQQLEDEQDATSTALWYLGVDPTDWVGGESGMKAAAQGNLMIGGKTYPNRDAWGDVPEGTITDFIFKLIEAQDSK